MYMQYIACTVGYTFVSKFSQNMEIIIAMYRENNFHNHRSNASTKMRSFQTRIHFV